MASKKKILIHSNGHNVFTGFGKNIKNVLSYLYKTGKYDLVEAANESPFYHPSYELVPWKKYGTLPENPFEINSEISKHPDRAEQIKRSAAYGQYGIDRIVSLEKPDFYIGIEDIWAFYSYPQKAWWNKTNCMIWTTLDSLPILPDAIDLGKWFKNYYVWSEFAEKSMKENGVFHVKTLHGAMDCSHFFPFSKEEKLKLRKKHGIGENVFIAGFVFRNQLRKTVFDLLKGLSLYNESSSQKAKVLLHTSWSEGWKLPQLIKEAGLSNDDVLTTYVCSQCKVMKVQSFVGEKQICPHCGSKESVSTVNIRNGVSEGQLNEVYNLMDMYVHPFTSGGQEIPIQEAKLAGLITAVTNYSCGEDMCVPCAASIPLDWTPYKEINTSFTKASTNPDSIASSINAVASMTEKERISNGLIARKFIIDNYSIEAVGKKLEEIIDSMPSVSYDFNFLSPVRNPEYSPNPISTDEEFVLDCYKGILGVDLHPLNHEIQFWVKKLKEGFKREQLYSNLVAFSKQELSKKKNIFENTESNKKKLLIVVPSDTYVAFLFSSFVNSAAKTYPDFEIFISVDERFKSLFLGNPKIAGFVPYSSEFSNPSSLEGTKDKKGRFDVVLSPSSQEISYFQHSHNGNDRNGLQCT